MIITSMNNELVKYYKKLMNSKKERDKENLFIVEGEHLVLEAIKENIVKEVMISDSKYDYIEGVEKIQVTENVIKKICNTVTPQGLIALCHQKKGTINSFNRLLILDDIQDPGNLGTIIRSACAFNFDGIIISEHTVDLYNPKVIRSTQGALFRVNIIRKELHEYINFLLDNEVTIFGTSLDGKGLSQIESNERMAFIMGNEGKGVNKTLLDKTHYNISIEMGGNTESLNVAIASSIIMYIFRK